MAFVTALFRPGGQLLGGAGLADARLAYHEQLAALPSSRVLHGRFELRELPSSPDERLP